MSKELDAIMQPKSIAIIGASTKEGAVGNEILSNLIKYGFTGDLYPVNPKAEENCGLKVYKSVLDIAGSIDMAVIIIPKDFVPAAIDECAKKGVKGLVIISAGYKETGAEGLKAEQELAAQVKKYGMKLVGPNCLGVINTDEKVKLDATFAMA